MITNKPHLPHIDLKDHYQFITFRTYDSVGPYLKKIEQAYSDNSQKQFAIDQYLDKSEKGAYLNKEILQFLYQFIQSKDPYLYELIAFCIMPNHVHLLIKPFKSLNKVMQYLKGGSAKIINEIRNKQGIFWASNYYDRLIRNEKHFNIVCQYIKNNPQILAEKSSFPPRFYSKYNF